MQDRTDAWTLTTQSWWTLFTHAVALSASESLTATWTSILTKGLGHNQDATDSISPVGLFVLTYTGPCKVPQNCVEGEGLIVNPYPTAFPYGNGMVLHFYQQQESSTTKTVHKVINKGLKAYV